MEKQFYITWVGFKSNHRVLIGETKGDLAHKEEKAVYPLRQRLPRKCVAAMSPHGD